MPSRLRVCSEPRCPELTEHPSRKCASHLKERRQATDAKRPNASARGYDAKWEAERKAYLKRFSDCERCGEPATDVHHVDDLGPLGPRGFDWTNFEGLCHSCHSAETGRTHGFPT